MQAKVIIYLQLYFLFSVLWSSCDTVVCDRRRLNIQCDTLSVILITKLSSSEAGDFDVIAYNNLRRMCLGMTICETSKPDVFCQTHKNVPFNVSYVCVRGKIETISE